MRLRCFLIPVLTLSTALCGQTPFVLPLAGTPFLTGNYGEVRPNHFHAGLDFRTDAKKNLPIMAVADGYVSRIKVGTHGYGKVLYITHPGGLVSVYGHQYSFNDNIKKYVQSAQDMLETFEVELFPKVNELKVKQGEIIGYTGNTGDSEGPHLHFEIRDEKSEVPLNPLRFVVIKDTVAPTITSLAVYDEDFTPPRQYKVKKKGLDTVIVGMKFGLGVECYDLEQRPGNKNNIVRIELLLDSLIYQSIVLDSIAFNLARYVNAYCDQVLRREKGIKVQKCFKGPNNDLSIYKNGHDGFLYLNDTIYHTLLVKVYDFYGHSTAASLVIKRMAATKMAPIKPLQVNCLKPWLKEEPGYKIEVPEKCFYKDLNVRDTIRQGQLSFFAEGYYVPLHKACTISLKVPDSLQTIQEKLCVINGSYCGGEYKDGFVSGTTKNFGVFWLMPDTTAPKIKFNKPKSKKKKFFKNGDIISFKVTDDISGISKFKLFINDKFYLAEYEHKWDMIFFEVSDKTPRGKINLKLEVTDKKNNISVINQVIAVE